MNKINNSIINQLFSFITDYYSDIAVAEYIFDIFSIDRLISVQDNVTYEKFLKVLNYIQRMSGDHHICFNAGRHYAKNRLFTGSCFKGIRYSAKKAIYNADRLLKEIFPEFTITINSKSNTRLELSIAHDDQSHKIDYFLSEYIKGILSYIPNYWGLPSSVVKIKSYPFNIEEILNNIDFFYQKKNSSYFAFEKKIAGESPHKKNELNNEKEINFQIINENLYIKYIYLDKDTLLNTGILKMEISWINKKKTAPLLLMSSIIIGIAAFIVSYIINLINNEILITLFILYLTFMVLFYNIFLKNNLKKLIMKIEADLTDEISQQKNIISHAFEDSSTKIQSIENLMMITKRLIQDENIVNLFDNIRKLTAKALNADRTTVFIHDKENKELRSGPELSEEMQEFRIPETRGIAGEIYKLRKIVNIKDAYNNPNFNKTVDRQTGYRTKTILGAPLIDLEDNLIGIIQVLNKNNGEFQKIDEHILESLSTYIAIALKNTMTIHKLQIQGIDPEIAKGLSSIIMSIYYGYQTIENELNLLDIPSINSLKPMIKDLTRLMEKMIFLFDDSFRINEIKITTGIIENSIKSYIEKQKKEKLIKFNSFSSIIEQEIYIDIDIINKAFSSILKNSVESIANEGGIIVHIYYYTEIPNVLMHEYALQNIMDSFCKYSDENSIGLINFIKNRKPLLEKDFNIIKKSMTEYIAINFFDTGEPINDEIKNKIFHPFFSTKNHFGLGLAIAKKAMTSIGGRIEEPRREGNGKSIRILVPLKREIAMK